MKRIFHTIPAAFVIMAFLLGSIVALLPEPVYAMPGSGTEEDPYMIYDVYDLQDMKNDLDAYYELANNIDASETITWNGGFDPVGNGATPFIGSFDGAGHTITGLYINRPQSYVGLFGAVLEGSQYPPHPYIKNVNFLNAYVKQYGFIHNNVGVLIGYIGDNDYPREITNCHVYSSEVIGADSWHVGGLIGRVATRAVIEHCSFEGDVTGFYGGVGGLVGGLQATLATCYVNYCYSIADVTGVRSDATQIGGMFGYSGRCIVHECFSMGIAIGDRTVGGFVGDAQSNSEFYDCYTRASATAATSPDEWTHCSGGFAGRLYSSGSVIDNCYSTGYVIGPPSYEGGLIGYVYYNPTVTNSFWDTETSGRSTSDGGTGKTTAEMKTESTFTLAGWNFDTVWAIQIGMNEGYPFLQHMPPASNLLRTYAPVLYMREGELFFPREITSMLNESDLKYNGETISGNVTTDDLEAHNEDSYYLDLRDAKPDPFYDVPDPQRFAEYPIVIYGREYEDPDYPDYIVLQYWFFYVYNSWEREYKGELYIGNHHEGDPEMATIILDKETQLPLWLTCARHWGGGRYYWTKVDLVGGTHPKIFVGQGSHASYATLGEDGAHWPLKNKIVFSAGYAVLGFNMTVDVVSDNGTALYPAWMDSSGIVGINDKEPYELADINQVPLSWWEGWWGERSRFFWGWDSPRSPAKLGDKWDNPVEWSVESPNTDYALCAVGSPVDLHAYDSYGNHVGLNETGGMEAEIPGTYLYLPSAEDGEIMWIYTDEYLRFEIEATDAGDFDFAIGRHIESSNETEILVAYEDVPITENTTATVELSPENPDYIMEVDLDGDGTVDEYREPDEIVVPEATTLELLPETDSNPVDTTHNLTATVYNRFGYEMEGVAVTWNISGVGSFSGTPEDVTDANGQADAVITSNFPGTSTVRCEVTGNSSVYDTAAKNWTYTPEATTVELLPETSENPVDTTHNLTATVYDQYGYEMEGVAVTWNISGVGSFSGTPESPTDANGQADAVITSNFPGTSTVRCEVTGNSSVYDTATKDWTYTPEATTVELLPGTDSNPVDTTHNLTATVYDQFGYEMEGVAVTWSIESGPGSFVYQDTTTDANGQADSVITSTVLGTSTVRCEVTGNPSVYDTATKDWTHLEDFEWGNDGDSLGMDGGHIDWTVETDGSSVAEIDTAQANSGTRSGRFYYDGSSENILAYYSQDSPTWRGFYLMKDKNAVAYTITGDGTNAVFIRVTKNEFVQYYDGSWNNVCKISANTWHFIEFRNIDWLAATYDIYVDNNLENSDTPMSASTSYNGLTAYYGGDYEGEFWIDDILK